MRDRGCDAGLGPSGPRPIRKRGGAADDEAEKVLDRTLILISVASELPSVPGILKQGLR